MTTAPNSLEHAYNQLSQQWDSYLQQLEWLEKDFDHVLQQLQADAHRLLARLQQERASVYAEQTKTEASWKRLRQLDQWTETLLQQLQQNQSRCLVYVREQRTTLYTELKLNCDGLLRKPVRSLRPADELPPTP